MRKLEDETKVELEKLRATPEDGAGAETQGQ